jgi:kynurenine---oxoglutarate transaminase / cysteine-S-conjugate beta-lyase / glutamine---phenylpyruvate transaminase
MWKNMSKKLDPFQYTVWTEFTPLAIKNKAVNLGQGFPGFECPDFIKQAIAEAADNNENQYSPPRGFPPLLEEIARVYGIKHNRLIDPNTEISVAHGASESSHIAFLSLLDEGDEVVVIDPAFDIYLPQISLAGGITTRVSLDPPINSTSPWTVNFEKLEAAFNPKTRVFVFNTPNNPIGKVFTRQELEKISEILLKWPNVAVIADEVYEHIIFDQNTHFSLCDLPGMWDRTVTLSSAGKLFSITGWKTGWAVGGADLIKRMNTAKLWTSYCSNTVCQGAIARGLRIAEQEYKGFNNYYLWLQQQYLNKRNILIKILENSRIVQIEPILSEGGFFLCGRIKNSACIPSKYLETGSLDFAFCRWLTEELKICAIPCSAFFSEENKHLGEDLVRFALCKDYPDYKKAEEILVSL